MDNQNFIEIDVNKEVFISDQDEFFATIENASKIIKGSGEHRIESNGAVYWSSNTD